MLKCILCKITCVIGKSSLHRDTYSEWQEEGIVINALGMALVALGILISYAVRSPTLKGDARMTVTERL